MHKDLAHLGILSCGSNHPKVGKDTSDELKANMLFI